MGYILIMYIISSLSIILGFIALLTQKIYIDPKTNKPTSIKIPFFGEMITNFPALVFLFVGGGLALFTFNKSYPPPPPKQVIWKLSGSFEKPKGYCGNLNWKEGTLVLIPNTVISSEIKTNGIYFINVQADEGKNIEDIFECIDYTLNDLNAQINLKDQYINYTNGKASLIENTTKTTRKYRTQTAELFHE